MALPPTRGYDPDTLSWVENAPANMGEAISSQEAIADEGLYTLMELRKRGRRSKMAQIKTADMAAPQQLAATALA